MGSGKTIGQGTFGKVKLGTHILSGEQVRFRIFITKVAVKILEKDRIKEVADVERVAREIHILKIIRHPNIIQLYEVSHQYLYLDNWNSKVIISYYGILFQWGTFWLHSKETKT